MDFAEQVNQYCERLDAGFWAEPANALSNIAFVIAALVSLILWARGPRRDWPVLVLIVVIGCVAAGSFLFHTLATRGAELLDVVPISLFIFGYFYLSMVRYLGMSMPRGVAATLAFAIASYAVARLGYPVLGSSAGYLPALLAIFGVAAAVARDNRKTAMILSAAGLLFMVSLTFRTLDGPMCQPFPIGTHFMWHILNAMVLNILLYALMQASRRADQAA